MIAAKKITVFLSLVIALSPLFADVVFEVKPEQQYDDIKPIWDIINLWSPSFMLDENGAPNTWLRDTHPFLNRIILMTATGGRPDYPQIEILKKDSLGALYYDFANFDSYLDAVMFNELKPLIVFASIPFVLAPNPYHTAAFGCITDPPTDYDVWHDFVKTVISHCVDRYSMDKVRTWAWRLYTEPDNRDWWSGTKEEYFKLYDYTVAAALSVIPDIIIGPGNMLGEIEDNWGLQFLDHAFAGTNYYTGKTGSYLKFFTISAYESCVKDHPPVEKFARRVQTIKDKLRHYGALDTVAIGFDEGMLLSDENGVRLWLGDGTEYGASWNAAYYMLGIREGFDRIVHWGLTSGGVKTPKYNVIEMLEKMKGDTRIDMQIVEDSRQITQQLLQKIDGIASLTPNSDSLKVFVYNHYKYRHVGLPMITDPQPVKIIIRDIPFATPRAWVRHWVVDSLHSNFFNVWLEESQELPRVPYSGVGGSIYDAGVTSNFNQDGHVFWWYHKPAYLEIDDLETMGPDSSIALADGALSVSINMRAHQVSLLEIWPDATTGIDAHPRNAQAEQNIFSVFPNPFNNSITIRQRTASPATIKIYAISGRLIKTLGAASGKNSSSVLSWDGTDESGQAAPSGVFMLRIETDAHVCFRKITLLR